MSKRLTATVLAVCLATVACAPKRRAPVVVFGLDGATWTILRPLAREGRLPTLSKWMRSGAWADLETLVPTLSPAIWTSLATGYPPERHGIRGFTVSVPGTGATTLPGTTERREPAIWNLASEAGLTVGVVNWWATFPAEQVRGFLVSDRANLHRRFGYRTVLGLSDPSLESLGSGETWPAGLLNRVLGALGDGEMAPEDARRLLLDPLPQSARRQYEAQRVINREIPLSVLRSVILQDQAARVATEVALADGSVPDLLLVYFSGIDAAEHQFLAHYQPEAFPAPPPADEIAALRHIVPAYYEYIDSTLATLMKRLPSDSLVMVVSDHGQVPNLRYQPGASSNDYGRLTSGTHESGPPGILLLSGAGVRAGKVSRAHVFDVAPTLLALLGIPPTADMPGSVIYDAFDDELRSAMPTTRVARASHERPAAPTPSPAEVDQEILEKLRALGYIR